jgi:aryl-alcohol dehydrogenase-like predicted oxidoreductase
MDESQHAGYAKNGMPVMAYTAQAQGLFSLVRDRGYEGLSEGMLRTYLNPRTRQRVERVLTVSAETGLSPTAVSLAYLLRDGEVKTYPILGISRPERLREALEVFALSGKDAARLTE